MLTSRQYATKYPGKVVHLSAVGRKEYKTEYDKPIGIVVGWRAGQLGHVGSSKVAVYRQDRDRVQALELFNERKYTSVIANPPSQRHGFYFLSVSHIEVVSTGKATEAYPHRCKYVDQKTGAVCNSPARRGANIIVCSNTNCKSNKKVFAAIGPIPKFYLLDKEGYVLCPTCQIKDKIKCREHDFERTTNYSSNHNSLVCRKANHSFKHVWREGQKLFHQGTQHYIWKNGQLASYNPKLNMMKSAKSKKK